MASAPTRALPPPSPARSERLQALGRMSFAGQLAALVRGEYTPAEWRGTRTAAERLEVLCGLCEDDQLDALRASCFTLGEWCAFARRAPSRTMSSARHDPEADRRQTAAPAALRLRRA